MRTLFDTMLYGWLQEDACALPSWTRDDEGYVWAMDLPGVDPTQVQISLQEGTLELEVPAPTSNTDMRLMHSERPARAGKYRVWLPERVDKDTVHAEFDQGVLRIRASQRATQNIPVRAL